MINYCLFGCQHNRGLAVLGFENVLGVYAKDFPRQNNGQNRSELRVNVNLKVWRQTVQGESENDHKARTMKDSPVDACPPIAKGGEVQNESV